MPSIEAKPLFPSPRKPGLPPDRWGVPLPVAIGIAALMYPFFTIPLGMLIFELLGIGPGDWLIILFLSVVAPLIVALGSGWIVMLVSFAIWYVGLAMVRSLRATIDDARLSAHVGGWTSLVMTLLVWRMFFAEYALGWGIVSHADLLLAFLLGPGIATPLAQYAGAWSQWPAEAVEPPRATLAFGIYQLMVATAWIAAGLALLKLTGLLGPGSLVFVGMWLVYQWLTLKVVFRYGAWKARRMGVVRSRWGWGREGA